VVDPNLSGGRATLDPPKMHPTIQSASESLGIDLPNLREAAEFSELALTSIREMIHERVPPLDQECLDVIVFGSLARHEAMPGSDLDYVVAVHRLPEDVRRTRSLMEAIVEAQQQSLLKNPGRSRMFGTVMSVGDIAERIGLEQDTNLNHSRRILLFQESASVFAPDMHDRLLHAILKRYLDGYAVPKKGVPRFLLNDVLRYWRTIAVDYQAKEWDSLEPDWGLRYIKLLISRKLAFAGTLASILRTESAEVEYFVEQFRMPALARLAQLESSLTDGQQRSLATILLVADEFTGLLANDEFRDEAKAVEDPNAVDADSDFARMRARAGELQKALEVVFFESSLRDRSIKYLSF